MEYLRYSILDTDKIQELAVSSVSSDTVCKILPNPAFIKCTCNIRKITKIRLRAQSIECAQPGMDFARTRRKRCSYAPF